MSKNAVNPDRLEFIKLDKADDISSLDCTENDGSDPLEVQRFVKENAIIFQTANLSTVYLVKYENEIMACFSVSMSAINVERLGKDEKIQGANFKSYPAMLLGQMCTDKKQRGRNIGSYVCKFALGLAQELSGRVACRYVMLHTDEPRANFYEKSGFIKAESPPIGGKLLMYRRISDAKLPSTL